MGRSRTARYQVGQVYMIKGEPYQVTKSIGIPGKEKLTLTNLLGKGSIKRTQSYR